MRLLILFGLATYAALIFQTAVPLWFPFRHLLPNLIVILTVDLGLRYHGAFAALIAFMIGYATDAFAGTHLGMNAFLMTFIFLLTYQISSRLLVTNALVDAIAVFFAVIVASIGAIVIAAGRGATTAVSTMMPGLLLQAFISALVAPIIFALLAGAKRLIGLPHSIES